MKKNIPEEDDIKEEDILGEAHFEIDKNAFKWPFTCCGRKTKKVAKKTSYNGLSATYEVWKCEKCCSEYVETDQSKKLERVWTLQMLLEGKAPKMERSLNYDGKTYFVRFPKDLTSGWKGKEKARMTMLTPEKYLVEIV